MEAGPNVLGRNTHWLYKDNVKNAKGFKHYLTIVHKGFIHYYVSQFPVYVPMHQEQMKLYCTNIPNDSLNKTYNLRAKPQAANTGVISRTAGQRTCGSYIWNVELFPWRLSKENYKTRKSFFPQNLLEAQHKRSKGQNAQMRATGSSAKISISSTILPNL